MNLELVEIIINGATLVSVLFVALNYFLARKKAKDDSQLIKDKEICEQAEIALSRSYAVLIDGPEDESLPRADRVNWLTSARQIQRYKSLKSEIKTNLYKLICGEHEEHWRHQFYLLMQHQEFLHPSYFKAKDDISISSENIDPTSALIIVNFSKWNRDIEDPLDIFNKDEFINDNFTLKGQIGLAQYIKDLREERIARRKKT